MAHTWLERGEELVELGRHLLEPRVQRQQNHVGKGDADFGREEDKEAKKFRIRDRGLLYLDLVHNDHGDGWDCQCSTLK